MKVMVFGANGFLGGEVARQINEASHEVVNSVDQKTGERIDLLDSGAIEAAILTSKPEAIVNCAGIVENTETAKLNVEFTTNILEAVLRSKVTIRRIIISGSAAEYGEVGGEPDAPVSETTPLMAQSMYGSSKRSEVETALKYKNDFGLPITIARIFNPIGLGMKPKFLLTNLITQLDEYRLGTREFIEVNRLDSVRDYIDVRDAASAILALIENAPESDIYNVGSGKATSNADLLQAVIDSAGLSTPPKIVEKSSSPEPQYAGRADISRMQNEFDWSPKYTLDETLKEIMTYAAKR